MSGWLRSAGVSARDFSTSVITAWPTANATTMLAYLKFTRGARERNLQESSTYCLDVHGHMQFGESPV